MKRLLPLFLALALVASARDQAPAGLYDSYTGFALPAEPVLPAAETHPSLWFRAADLPALRAKRTANDYLRARWAAVQKLADLKSDLPPAPTAKSGTEPIHRYYGALSIAARAHALASLLQDDAATQAAHHRRAVALLLRAYDGPIFELDSNEKGSAVDEIYRGSWLQNYAAAYDCVQPLLTPEEDRAIRARLELEARCVHENLNRWTPTSPHNHLSKPAWGLGSVALAMSSHPEARAWLGRALEASNRNTRYFFSGYGLYREGSHYLMFSLVNFVPFLYHYRNVSGVDGFGAFQPVLEAMIQTRSSRGWLPNIEDSYLRPTPTHLVAAAYRLRGTTLHPRAPLGELLQWSYRQAVLAPFEGERAGSGLNYTGASWDYPLELEEFLVVEPALPCTFPTAAPNVFLAGGQTVLRDSWTNRGDRQRYVLFHGVAPADNHNHHDQLSFILEAEGQLMASDSGYSRGTYAGAERTNWYLTAPAHNTLTFDGQPSAPNPTNATPPSVFRTDQPGLAGEEKAADFPGGARWNRLLLLVAGDYVIVADRVRHGAPGELRAYLHGGRGRLEVAGDRHTWVYADDRYGRAAQMHSWIAAPGATVQAKEGEMTYIKGDYASFPYLEISRRTDRAAWLTLLAPQRPSATPALSVDVAPAGPGGGLIIRAPDHACVVATQPEAGPEVVVGPVATDGSFALVRRDLSGRMLAFCAREATYLRIDGQDVWRAPVRQDVARTTPAPTPITPATPSSLPGSEAHIYRDLAPEPLRLHVFKPDGWKPTDRRPALVFFFGGGWTTGTAANAAYWGRVAADLGMVGIAPDYRTKQRFDTPPQAAVADARQALRWVQDHGAELGVDPARVVVGGNSAGGHLALWTAIPSSPPGSDPAEAPVRQPAALLLFSAVSDTSPETGYTPFRFGAEAEDLSPQHRLPAKLPPVLAFHGDADQTVPYRQAVALQARLAAGGHQAELLTIPGGSHGYLGEMPEWREWSIRQVKAFLGRLALLPTGT